MKTVTATAPSAWAGYLINGDASGIDANDIAAAQKFVDWAGAGFPVSCEDAGFRWHFDADIFTDYAGADCQTYTFLVPSVNPPEYWLDGTDTGIAMRATNKGRIDSLIAMVQGDRRDALEIDRLVGTPDAKRVQDSLAAADESWERQQREGNEHGN